MSIMDTLISRRTFTASSAAAVAALAAGARGPAVLAQDATPAPDATVMGLPPLPEGALLVAQGLYSPRFLALGADATLYITDAGVGGDEALAFPAPPGATPVSEDPAVPAGAGPTRGTTGQVVSVTSDGTQAVVASGLPSYTLGPGAAVGPAGVVLGDGELFVAVGGAAVGNFGLDEAPGENAIHRIDLATGEVTEVVALGDYEIENNPDGADINPNLYQMTRRGDGQLLVTDAGSNTVFAVNPATGAFELLATIPALGQLPGGATFTGGEAGRQPVPTGVAIGGGVTFVGLLSDTWPEGAPSVLSLGAGGALATVASSLTYNVGLAIGPDRNLYATQMASPPAPGSDLPGPGSVVRIYGDGTVEPVVEGLPAPHGVTFDVAGNMYIPVYSAFFSTPDAPAGAVIRIDGVAAV